MKILRGIYNFFFSMKYSMGVRILVLPLVSGFTGATVLYAQSTSVPVMDFAEFEPFLQKQNDTTYVINFWATWCVPCIKELPYFTQLHDAIERGGSKQEVLLVSLDFTDKLAQSLYPFMQKHNLQPDVIVLDDPKAHSWIDKVNPSWSGAIPATLVYRNNERKFREGSFSSYDELKEFIKPLIKNDSP